MTVLLEAFIVNKADIFSNSIIKAVNCKYCVSMFCVIYHTVSCRTSCDAYSQSCIT